VKKQTHFKVVAFPRSKQIWGHPTEQDARELCQGILASWDLQFLHRGAQVQFDSVCSFCGALWEVDEQGRVWCCDAAVSEWKAAERHYANTEKGG